MFRPSAILPFWTLIATSSPAVFDSDCFNDRGSITVEYTVLLCLVAVGCSVAVIGLGAPLVRMFVAQELWLLLAVP